MLSFIADGGHLGNRTGVKLFVERVLLGVATAAHVVVAGVALGAEGVLLAQFEILVF